MLSLGLINWLKHCKLIARFVKRLSQNWIERPLFIV